MIFQNRKGLTEEGNSYKGNLHSHTVNSDGRLTPEEAVSLYRSRGYSFLCFSEHDRYTDLRSRFDSGDFIILPGLEASADLLDPAHVGKRLKTHHMHGILGTERMQAQAACLFRNGETLKPPVYTGQWDGLQAAQGVCDRLRAHGCVVTYNHPLWSRVEPQEFADLHGVLALEIYNYNTVNESGTGYDTACWDLILRRGRQIYAFASDDNHNGGRFEDSCGGWVVVRAAELTHEAVIQALLSGNFYCSSGPEIYGWEIRDDRAIVHCSPCERINIIAGGDVNAGATFIAPTKAGICHTEYPLHEDETYVRAECTDYNGKTAWSNAIFLRKEQGMRESAE
ncbi:MAG: CehA/McbA family metallohydrolase [Lachnospiraceae bacterium]|jgi:hypothetical protein|nr:CehA/McbA family metallohydrolase [Lachnospiraceae bacterium]